MKLSSKLIGGIAAGTIATLAAFGATAQVNPSLVITGEDAAMNGEMNMINAATARG
ncbi:MAG: hypothetical protein RJB62_282, partial [Pseudomonadota bacterium]